MRPTSALVVGIVALMLLGTAACGSGSSAKRPGGFVSASGPHLMLNGRRFYFAGINADYIPHRDKAGAAADLRHAKAEGFTVVRMFGFLDVGNPAIPSSLAPLGYQYWSATGQGPVYNDGPSPGLGGLDYAIYQAHREGLHVIIPLVNNWSAFGGMDAYVCWRFCTRSNSTGRCWQKCFVGYHSDFYTDPMIVSWYKAWIAHVLNHVNVYTQIAYKNDPTILAWQLANEPRCEGANKAAYPRSPSCRPDATILPWVRTMASYLKSIDHSHLLSVGDEGFLCAAHPTGYTDNCTEGDSVGYTRVPDIDFMAFHDYPMSWNQCPTLSACVSWGNDWIKGHIYAADLLRKPALLDEFGLVSGNIAITPAEQSSAYQTWTGSIYRYDAAGDLVWNLAPSAGLGSGGPYSLPCPSPSCAVLEAHASAMAKK